jgi:hypothetical protein
VDPNRALVTFEEAARYLGIHTSTLRRWITGGKLNAVSPTASETPKVIETSEILRVRALLESDKRP